MMRREIIRVAFLISLTVFVTISAPRVFAEQETLTNSDVEKIAPKKPPAEEDPKDGSAPEVEATLEPPPVRQDKGGLPRFSFRISVDESYKAIPHRRVKIDIGSLSITSSEREYVSKMFAAIDQGVVLRVVTLQDYRRGNFNGDFEAQHKSLFTYVTALAPPSRLEEYHWKIVKAFRDQASFFREWRGNRAVYSDWNKIAKNREVVSASKALREAYSILMNLYKPKGKNADAFFDYHCALDFI